MTVVSTLAVGFSGTGVLTGARAGVGSTATQFMINHIIRFSTPVHLNSPDLSTLRAATVAIKTTKVRQPVAIPAFTLHPSNEEVIFNDQ